MAIKVHGGKSSYIAIIKELNKSFKLPVFFIKKLKNLPRAISFRFKKKLSRKIFIKMFVKGASISSFF
jgi:hypothetical protein